MEGAVLVRAQHPRLGHSWAEPERCQRKSKADDGLPVDPRNWSRADVSCWLQSLALRHGLPVPPSERFPMNGKALCLMSVDMYLHRVPLGGKLLYRDFQLRLARAMYST